MIGILLDVAGRVSDQTSTSATSVPCVIAQGGAHITSVCSAASSLHIQVAYRSILPILVLVIGALGLLAISAVLPKRSRPGFYAILTVGIGALALAASVWQWHDIGNLETHVPTGTEAALTYRFAHQLTIGGQVFYDRFSVLFMALVSVATILGAVTSDSYLRREGLDGVEAYVLMLMAGTGAMLMAASAGLITLFLGLEIMSISLYVMAAYHRRRTQSGEAGLKYFVLGAFSSAIFLYGIALVYGATGSTQFVEMAGFLGANSLINSGVLLAGIALLIVGLGFKVAAVPFHFWAPDVYQGSPTPFTGYMAAVAKAAGFAGLIRVLDMGLIAQQANWRPAIWFIAVLTLLVGSVMAIAQRDLKRMLAYSSISQAGYVLVGLQAASSTGTAGAVFYLFTYTFIIIGTFAVISIIQGPGEARNDLGAVRGLAKRRPLLAAVMLVFLLAQAGVPFTSGFLAKFYVIQAAVQRGQYPLAIIAMLSAAIAAFFYLRVALLMYGSEGDVPVDSGASAEAVRAGGSTGSAGDASTLAGLAPIASLDGTTAVATLLDPPDVDEPVRLPVAVVLGICVVFTIAAGVSSPMIDIARHATTLFSIS